MLMMRLQRVGRKNDPSYRIVVTDKRSGPKSDKHVDRLGSYSPKMNHVQLDAEKAKSWIEKGVQPSDTVHNILVGQKVIDSKKRNVLPRKSPIVDEEALKKAEEEKAAAEAKAAAESSESAETSEAEEVTDRTEEVAEEAPATEVETEEPAKEVVSEAAESAPETEAEQTEEEKK